MLIREGLKARAQPHNSLVKCRTDKTNQRHESYNDGNGTGPKFSHDVRSHAPMNQVWAGLWTSVWFQLSGTHGWARQDLWAAETWPCSSLTGAEIDSHGILGLRKAGEP